MNELKIEYVPLDDNQYFHEVFKKQMIVLHHTAGTDNAKGVISWWNSTPERIATPYVIERSGKIYQCFDDSKWSHHLGVNRELINRFRGKPNEHLNKISIGIELTNWGYLTEKNGKFYSYTGKEIPRSEVCDLGFEWRGYRYFHDYSKAQIDAAISLTKFLIDKHKIFFKKRPFTQKIEVSKEALNGEAGIWFHSHFTFKTDCYPHPYLIEQLNTITP